MNEIYWLTRVGIINTIGVSLIIVSVFILLTLPLWNETFELSELGWDKLKKIIKSIITVGVIGLIIVAFVPSKKDMLLIYGLGPVVEYVKGNDKLKEIPDNAIEAIIEWMDLKKEEK